MPTPAIPASDPDDDALRRHWRARPVYTMVQTGCGDGVQFLQTWAALLDDPDAPQRLHYLMIGPQLPTPERLRQRPGCRPELADQLCRAWPPQVPGYHRLLLQQGRVVLTLISGEIAASLMQLNARVDCFLLHDGLEEIARTVSLLRRIGRLAAPEAQLRTGGTSRLPPSALAQAGFAAAENDVPARFAPRWKAGTVAAPHDRRAIVIGAGLAGSAACESLAARSWQVTLIERHAQPAQEASGNLAGVYMPVISRDDNPAARLTRAAFLFAQQVWARAGIFDSGTRIGEARGVLQVARDAVQAEAFRQAAQHWRYPQDYAQWWTEHEATARLGMASGSGWFFPRGGWLRPGAVCEAMLQACGERLQRRFQHEAICLQRADGEWQAVDAAGKVIAQAPVVILANGMQSARIAQASSLPLQAIRGQVSHVPADSLPDLPFALCGDGYVTGAVSGMVSVGASYDQDSDSNLRTDSHAGNLRKLHQLLPGLEAEKNIDHARLEGRVGFRCVSADRLPLVGLLPDLAALSAAGEVQLREVPRWPQLYGLLAYASRGLIWAPLAAEIVACALEGEPAPLGKDLLALLDPARFALKAHRQAGG